MRPTHFTSGLRGVHVGGESAHGRSHKLKRGLDLGAIRVASPELRRINHSAHDGSNIAIGTFESPRHASDKCRRRIIRNEAPGELSGNKLCGAGILYRKVYDLRALFHPAGLNLFPENDLRIGIVDAFVKFKLRIFARFFDGPSSKAAGDFGYVLLGVAAVNPEGVQLHQLASIIFVQTAVLLFLVLDRGVLWHVIESAACPPTHGALLGETLGRTRISA